MNILLTEKTKKQKTKRRILFLQNECTENDTKQNM